MLDTFDYSNTLKFLSSLEPRKDIFHSDLKIPLTEDNLIIKGDNLQVLSSFLEHYEGKVKCIYIDPPYYFHKHKSSGTFDYDSNFTLKGYLEFMHQRLAVA